VKILLLGSSGFLGIYLNKVLKEKFTVITTGLNKRKNDLTKYVNIKKLIEKTKPNIIINASGLTDIEICQSKPNLSEKINIDIIKNIFLIRKKNNFNFEFLHFSTDHMYNPKNNIKNNELMSTSPVNTYTKHKLQAEKICLTNNSLVFRLNLIGKSRSSKKSFTDWIYEKLKKNDEINGFIDSFYSPLSVETVAKIIKKIILKKLLCNSGIFNMGSKDGISKYNLIVDFSKKLGIYKKNLIKKNKINRMCKTKRSNYNRLNTNKFEKVFKIHLPFIKSEINKVTKHYEKI
jgi:dTDP-4-dehydrorhamnose reductase